MPDPRRWEQSSLDHPQLADTVRRRRQVASTLRNTLIEKGVLLEEGDFLIFTSDYSFTSASAAAATVIGASANGRILWKLPDGRTYADWETSQDVTNGTSS
ncbi:DUF4357 domain-containing protein [Jannaschia helgolandensis]|uniref:DUF4357 domain-containing protein n=1 Tax=Jannaschia helgolandensis TaxID=188906 RepID=UPI001FE06A00|nr:DUF4357 domain-containing protein [Jannaschia helgolandensis]